MFAQIVKDACRHAGISHNELARRLGVGAGRVVVMLRTDNMTERVFLRCLNAMNLQPEIRLHERGIKVPSQSIPGQLYNVTATSCDCPGFDKRGQCKHLIAYRALLLQKLYPDRDPKDLIREVQKELTSSAKCKRSVREVLKEMQS